MPLVKAYVVPHPPLLVPAVGRGEEKKIPETAAAMRRIADDIAALKADGLILISPHAPYYRDAFFVDAAPRSAGSLARFNAAQPRLEFSNDLPFIRDLDTLCRTEQLPLALTSGDAALDHASFVPLYFITQAYSDFALVRIGLSMLDRAAHSRLGACLRKLADASEKRYVLVASGDLSHCLKADGPYGYHEAGPVFDQVVVEGLRSGDLAALSTLSPKLCDDAGECGYRSLLILQGALGSGRPQSELLSYENFFGVGYACAILEPQQEAPAAGQAPSAAAEVDPYLSLARLAIESKLLRNQKLNIEQAKALLPLPPEMLERQAGVFVTLHKGGELRGCIGTIEAQQDSIAEEILQNALSSAFRDPRFPPLTAAELDEITYSVDVLEKAEACRFDELDPAEYGVIVSSGYRRGLLLPRLEGLDDPQEQVNIALRKAGISAREPYALERFRVLRHE